MLILITKKKKIEIEKKNENSLRRISIFKQTKKMDCLIFRNIKRVKTYEFILRVPVVNWMDRIRLDKIKTLPPSVILSFLGSELIYLLSVTDPENSCEGNLLRVGLQLLFPPLVHLFALWKSLKNCVEVAEKSISRKILTKKKFLTCYKFFKSCIFLCHAQERSFDFLITRSTHKNAHYFRMINDNFVNQSLMSFLLTFQIVLEFVQINVCMKLFSKGSELIN